MSEFQYVKSPNISETEMNAKVDELRTKVSHKMQKWADTLQFSMYSTPSVERMEGERWLEGGKTWVMTGGKKISTSILQEARMPIWCPKCEVAMNHRFDRKFYYLRGHCFNCNVALEGKMRREGTWEEFERRMIRENEKSFLRDKISQHMDYIKNFKEPQLHFSDGRWEKLATRDMFESVFEELEKDIEFMLARLEVIRKEEEDEKSD